MPCELLDTISIINGLQYGLLSGMFSLPLVEEFVLKKQLSNAQRTAVSITNRISSLLATMTLKRLLQLMQRITLLRVALVGSILASAVLYLFYTPLWGVLVVEFATSMSCQLLATIVPVLVSEQDRERGSRRNTVFSLCISLGVILGAGYTYAARLGLFTNGKLIYALYGCLMAGFMLLSFQFSTDSSAKTADLERHQKAHSLMKTRGGRRSLCVAILIAASQQFTGVASFDVYHAQILQGVLPGLSDGAAIGSLMVQSLDVAALFSGALVVKSFPRKKILRFTLWICSIANIIKAAVFIANLNRNILLVAQTVFAVMFQVGPGGIYYAICAEIFPSESKNQLFALTQSIKRVLNIIIVAVFPLLPFYANFVIYAVGSAISAFLVVKILPETFQQSQVAIDQFYIKMDEEEEHPAKML